MLAKVLLFGLAIVSVIAVSEFIFLMRALDRAKEDAAKWRKHAEKMTEKMFDVCMTDVADMKTKNNMIHNMSALFEDRKRQYLQDKQQTKE